MWWVGGPEADLGSSGGASDLGKCMKGEALWNEYLKKYFTWGKCIKGKALWKESDNELHQIEGC